MKLLFTLPYKTSPGQRVLIVGSTPEFGHWNTDCALRMNGRTDHLWQAAVILSEQIREPIAYRYAIEDQHAGTTRLEGGPDRHFSPNDYPGIETMERRDFWRPPGSPDVALATAPFRKTIFRQQQGLQAQETIECKDGNIPIRLYLPAPRIKPGQVIYCTGNIPALGFWNPEKALPLHPCAYPDWQVDFSVRRVEIPFQYKYFIADTEQTVLEWEEGDNRCLTDPEAGTAEDHGLIVVSDYAMRSTAAPWKGAGLSIPVFSLRTARGLGVGEFHDLKPLVDWAKKMGLKMIQILPVNDTSVNMDWHDAYPYSPLSVFALHPLYLSLRSIDGLPASLIRDIDAAADILNSKSVVDYEAVMSTKMAFLRKIFALHVRRFLASEAFRAFLSEHAEWLKPYAAFCYLRDLHGTSDCRVWKEFRTASPAAIEHLTAFGSPQEPEIAFHYFLQYHLHHQLLEAAQYAREHGVVLKGDIPIGVDRNSVETWLYPEWFRLDKSAGAPPDDFAVLGQNWGFPTYNWEAMAADGYSWWKRRLIHLSRYFDAVRLDHIIGFFRIWEIPGHAVTALRGRFNPAIPLSRSELEDAGIRNVDDLCEVSVSAVLIERIFGPRAEEMIREYLEPSGTDRYRLRPEFDAQNKIVDRFFSLKIDAENRYDDNHNILKDLLNLYDDVILIPDRPDVREPFHPRIAMDKTWAFRCLDGPTQAHLKRIYEEYYFNRQESLWARSAQERLSALKSATDMLICGEDLGMIPLCTGAVMEEMGLLSLRIQRMPVEPWEIFGKPAAYPYLSVASSSSHDMTTVRGWWQDADRAVIQFYYSNVLGHAGIAPKVCEPWISREIIALHLNSGSMWTVFPIQDILGASADLMRTDPHEERINEPADAQRRWNFRLHVRIEDLLLQQAFNLEIMDMVRTAGR